MKYKKAGKIHYPLTQELLYRRKLLKLVNSLKSQVTQKLISKLKLLSAQNLLSVNRDDVFDDIERIITDIKIATEYDTLNTIKDLLNVANSISKFTLLQITKALAGKINIRVKPEEDKQLFGIDIYSSPFNNDIRLLTKSWVYTNTRLIKTIPENLLNDVAIVVQTGFRAGTSIKDIAQQIKTKFNVSESRAKLIARDQTAKLNSDIAKNEYLKLGLDTYIWATSNDEGVRTSHKVLHNKICSWQNPTIYKNSTFTSRWLSRSSLNAVQKDVGQDYQCRCTPIALIPIK